MAAKSARKGPTKAKKNLLDSLGVESVDYKDTATLRVFISDRGKIRSRGVTGLTVQQQRQVAQAIKTPARWRCCPTRARTGSDALHCAHDPHPASRGTYRGHARQTHVGAPHTSGNEEGAARIFRQLTPAAVAHYFMMTIMFISPSGCTRT